MKCISVCVPGRFDKGSTVWPLSCTSCGKDDWWSVWTLCWFVHSIISWCFWRFLHTSRHIYRPSQDSMLSARWYVLSFVRWCDGCRHDKVVRVWVSAWLCGWGIESGWGKAEVASRGFFLSSKPPSKSIQMLACCSPGVPVLHCSV